MWVCVKCGKDFPTSGTCPECGGPLVPTGPTTNGLAGRVLNERYTLLEPLGSGGMGTVFRAKRRDLDAFFAIKILRNDLNPDTDILPRFFAEARHASQLKHPHTVRVFDFGATSDGLIYLVMELVDGVLISQLDLPLPVRRALAIARQVCGAVAEAHERGLVHRDIKPDNIMVSRVDGRDFARILDFGIATLEATTGMTADGTMVGTPEYISPEQAAGLRVDRRADVYGLGLVLYEMVTGRPPFKGSRMVVAYKHINEQPPAPSTYADLPHLLDRLLLECLAKKPEDRPQSIAALRRRLDDCIAVVEGKISESEILPPTDTGSRRTVDVTPTGDRPAVAEGEGDSKALDLDTATMLAFLPNRKRRLVAAALFILFGAFGLWILTRTDEVLQDLDELTSPVSADNEPEFAVSPDDTEPSADAQTVSLEAPNQAVPEGTGDMVVPAEGTGEEVVVAPEEESGQEVIVNPPRNEESREEDEREVEASRDRRRGNDEENESDVDDCAVSADADEGGAEADQPGADTEEDEQTTDPRAVIRSRTQQLLER